VKRILVVDDEPTILAAVATRLRASHDGTPPSDACAEYWDDDYSR
jgi:hypothetical protein